MMKAISTFITGLFVVLIVWILFSWIDVLSHNDPVYGDRAYSPLNAFCVLEEYGTPK